ncbi:Alcohol dehydrogenase transcription factor Myb/SANT-like family protein [Thalictrum thalictroides]|uniref:Alcohol dehydrogenase transcription factor Myb/SANT-like family protein n=1 Tax=Thalictrum thalictroides TaxID=46969 RepID=A0A7J6W805_THATH|nr:Alcohol dehydrogenase transcription factor Myb/SANT-like family protein [Thalictrum thalictroides]
MSQPSSSSTPTPQQQQQSLKTPSIPKKIPPIPWAHIETVNLIEAYQEKWYSLKRGQLKASQWEEVASDVAARCGFKELSKSATQCRHKMEKLRKRYRTEKQRGGRLLSELASVVRAFGEGFVKVENMKLEMMKEAEKHRIEMEKKRMEMIQESQRCIVDAIAKTFESNKKPKMTQEDS